MTEQAEPLQARRRQMRWIALSLVALLITGAILAVAWLRSYEPLAWKGGATIAGEVVEDEFPDEEPPLASYDYRAGGTDRFSFDVTNTGRFPVTIEGLAPDDPEMYHLVHFTGLQFVPGGDNAKTWEGAQPFHPVTVEPGEQFWLLGTFSMSGCGTLYTPGTFMSRGSIRLRTSYLWVVHREQTVDMPFQITVACPDA